MTNKLRTALALALVVVALSAAALSPGARAADEAKPKPAPTPSLDQMTVGRCEVAGLSTDPDDIFERERRVGLVMDARTSAVNQAVGKLSFSGNAGRVTVVNMNPFVYSYKIEVAQKELVTTALNDFVKLLLPPALNKAVGLESGEAARGLAAEKVAGPNKLSLIASRLNDFDLANCLEQAAAVPPPPADANIETRKAQCEALGGMKEAFERVKANAILKEEGNNFTNITNPQFTILSDEDWKQKLTDEQKYKFAEVKKKLTDEGKNTTPPADDVFAAYSLDLTKLRDAEATSRLTCDRASDLNAKLSGYDLKTHFAELKRAQQAIEGAQVLANDLKDLAVAYGQDAQLKDSAPVVRCKGYNCVKQFEAYADAALATLLANKSLLDKRRANAEEMRTWLRLTDEMKGKEGLFARTFPVFKKFELSEATITVTPSPLPTPQRGANGLESGSANPAGDVTPAGEHVSAGGPASGGLAPLDPSLGRLESGNPTTPPPPTPSPTPAARAASAGPGATRFTIGRPLFALSGGLAYSPLPRRTFQSVKGFVRDAQGNPTGDGSADVVGYGENSSRRLTPMVQLNTRLADLDPVTLYFSMGVSAKYDDNLDIEYLFGPSVGLLDNRLLFTAGVYAGRTQNLVPDVAVGDVLPDTLGDAKLFRKSHTWKPGFSFSYFFTRPASETANNEGGGGGGGTSTPAPAGARSEIRIGGIPFNLAAGMAFTSLEQRTYDEVAGFARDRQGNLTNGETLTRIVGRTSSADYRISPVVLLHSRLTDFRRHNFYFSAGVTGKKTDNDFDIEYLLGGSVNLHRKLFLTFGTFAGKQRTLGGDFFEGAALGKTQNVTTQDRYVWKPAFSFSYDLTRFIPGTNPPR